MCDYASENVHCDSAPYVQMSTAENLCASNESWHQSLLVCEKKCVLLSAILLLNNTLEGENVEEKVLEKVQVRKLIPKEEIMEKCQASDRAMC